MIILDDGTVIRGGGPFTEIGDRLPLHAIAGQKLVFWVIQAAIPVAFRLHYDTDQQQFFVGDRCVAVTAERYAPF